VGDRLVVRLEKGDEVGGWKSVDLDDLRDRIGKHLPKGASQVAVKALGADKVAPARTVILVRIVLPEEERSIQKLLEDARVAKLHAVVARRMKKEEREGNRLHDSPMFLIQAMARYKVGDKYRDYEFSDDTLKAGAPKTGKPCWPNRVPNPQAATTHYAQLLGQMLSDCKLAGYDVTSLCFDKTVDANAKSAGDLLHLLSLLFHIVPEPEAPRGGTLAKFLGRLPASWIAGAAGSESTEPPMVYYMMTDSDEQLRAFLSRVSGRGPGYGRSVKALVNSSFEAEATVASSNLWHVEDSLRIESCGRYLTYVVNKSAGKATQEEVLVPSRMGAAS
jgi:hypothetical protein